MNKHGKNLLAPISGLCSIAAVTLAVGWLGTQPAAIGTVAFPGKATLSASIPPRQNSPVHFEPNLGQADARIDYLSRGLDHALYLTHGAAVVALRDTRDNQHRAALRISTPGGNPAPAVHGEEAMASRSHYLHGSDAARWHTDVPNYRRVRYENIYPDIDLVYYGNGRKLEYDFIVAPGADPNRIELAFDGADAVTIETNGALRLALGDRALIQHAPVIYQNHHGRQQAVAGHYIYRENGTIGFQIAAYDATLPLVIDPVLDYSTYLGGSGTLDIGATGAPVPGRAGDDRAYAVAMDNSGSIYVAGSTLSGDFPTTPGAFATHCGSNLSVDCNTNYSVSITAVTLPAGTVTITVSDPDLNTNAATAQSTTVSVVNDGTGESESVILTETGANTGVFAGTLSVTVGTAAGANNDGTLAVLGGSSISATYNDAQTPSGGAATVIATTPVPEFNVVLAPLAAAGNNLTVIVKDVQLNLDSAAIDTGFVQVANSSTGEIESVAVIETAVSSSVFTGTLATVPGTTAGADDDGTLNVQNGDQLTASYPFPATLLISEVLVAACTFDAQGALSDPACPDRLNINSSAIETITAPIVNDRTGEIEDVLLTETDINTGMFFGRVPTRLASGAGTSNSGVMTVQSNDTFAATGSLTVTSNGNVITTSTIASTAVTSSVTVATAPVQVGGNTLTLASIGFPGENITITVNDSDLNTNGSATETTSVTVTNTRTGESETLALSETGTNTGVFAGVLPTSSSTATGSSNDGTLNVTDGDSISASYDDARTSNGTAATITDTATVGGFNTGVLNDALAKTDAFVTKFDKTGTLVYSTYLGGGNFDSIADIAVDTSGNASVTGTTLSTDFPTKAGGYDIASCADTDTNGTCDGGERIFVTQLNSTGTSLVWSTFIGYGNVHAIAINAAGQAYITGSTTSTAFPTQGPYQATYRGGASDAFVTKLNSAATALVYSTYLGGSGPDYALDIALNSAGDQAYVTGYTASTNFPTVSAYDTTCGVSGTCNNSGNTLFTFDAFVTRLNAAGSGLLYSTYLGGSKADYGHGIAIDTAGNAYITGETSSANFPTTAGVYDSICDHDADGNCDGGAEVFVTKLADTGSAIGYSTYVAGGSPDTANAIAVDASGSVFVTGTTYSTFFPDATPSFNIRPTTFPGDFIKFIVRSTALNTDSAKVDKAALLVTVSYLNGQGQVVATESEAVPLTETSGNSNIFTATLRTEFGNEAGKTGDRKLQIINGKTFTATYTGPLAITATIDTSLYTPEQMVVKNTIVEILPVPVTNDRTGEIETAYAVETGTDTNIYTAQIPIAQRDVIGTNNDGILEFMTGATFSSSISPAPVITAVDATGAATATFGTDSDFMRHSDRCTENIITPALSCNAEAYLFKLDPAGASIEYLAYLAGNGHDYGLALALDTASAAPVSRVAIAGYSNSIAFPVTSSAYQATHKNTSSGGDATGNDAFVSVFQDSSGNLTLTDDKSDAQDPNNTNPTSRSAAIGDNAAIVYTIKNNGATPVEGVVLRHKVSAPYDTTLKSIKDGASGMLFVSAVPGTGTCTYAKGLVTCDVGKLAVDATVSVTITATAQAVGAFRGLTWVEAYHNDANLADNYLASDTSVTAPLVAAGTAAKTSGSGSLELLTLLALGIWLSATTRRRWAY